MKHRQAPGRHGLFNRRSARTPAPSRHPAVESRRPQGRQSRLLQNRHGPQACERYGKHVRGALSGRRVRVRAVRPPSGVFQRIDHDITAHLRCRLVNTRTRRTAHLEAQRWSAALSSAGEVAKYYYDKEAFYDPTGRHVTTACLVSGIRSLQHQLGEAADVPKSFAALLASEMGSTARW